MNVVTDTSKLFEAERRVHQRFAQCCSKNVVMPLT
jgi:hypothetical protein